MPLLEVDDVHLAFAGVKAIDGVSFTVQHQRAVRHHRSQRRRQDLDLQLHQRGVPPQQRVDPLRRHGICSACDPTAIADLGIARTFQNIELFPQLTVLDNLMLGRHHASAATARWPRSIRVGKAAARRLRNREVGRGHHRVPRAASRGASPTSAMLPYGVQKRVELGRALAMAPEAAAARRAGGRDEPRGDRGHGPLHPRHPRRAGHRDHPRRARHAPGHGPGRHGARRRLRPADRRRHPARDPDQPGRDPGLPGRGARRSRPRRCAA